MGEVEQESRTFENWLSSLLFSFRFILLLLPTLFLCNYVNWRIRIVQATKGKNFLCLANCV